MALADFAKYKQEFVAEYNANKGLAPVAAFQSGNCCFGVSSPRKPTETT